MKAAETHARLLDSEVRSIIRALIDEARYRCSHEKYLGPKPDAKVEKEK